MTPENDVTERFFSDAEKLTALLERYKAFFDSDFLHQVCFEVESLKKTLSMGEDEANTLKIGVVGAMKAGKSSFLNMLLFDGKDFLPKASTPMTAALTKIKYSPDCNRAVIHFYSEDDWKKIEEFDRKYQEGLERDYAKHCREIAERNKVIERQRAASGMAGACIQTIPVPKKAQYEQTVYKRKTGLSEFESGAHELVLAMDNSGDDLRAKLGAEETHEGRDLTSLLGPYVGAHGKYTPIVNYVELSVAHPDLQGVEIVDMPGLGDPIVSRCRVTKDFIKQCDAVLFLSTCSQFMTDRDMASLTRLLPSAGIQDGLIIASRFDGAITGYLNKLSLDNAWKKALSSVEQRYGQEIQKLPVVLRKAFQEHPLLVTSSMADTLMRKRSAGETLSGDEPKVYESLKTMNGGADLSPKDLRSLSGIVDVKKELQKLQAKKQEIISRRKDTCAATARKNVLHLITQLLEAVQIATKVLETQSVEGARRKRSQMESALDRAATSIASHFTEAAFDARKKLQEIASDLVLLRNKYGRLEVTEHERKHREKEHHGFLGLRTDYYTYVTKTYSLETAQIEEQVHMYAADCQKQIGHSFDFLVDTDQLRRSITDIVLKALGEEDFDEEDVLTPLRTTFAKIKLPPFSIDPNEYVDEVHSQYPRGVATGTEIHVARQMLTTLLSTVQHDIKEKLEAAGAEIGDILDSQSTGFVSSLRSRMGGELQRIEAECADKEKNLKERRNFVEALHEIQEKMSR